MRRPSLSVTLSAIPIVLAVLGVSDANALISDTGVSNIYTTSDEFMTSNSSAGATITITMYTVADK